MKKQFFAFVFAVLPLFLSAQKKSSYTILSDSPQEAVIQVEVGDIAYHKVTTPQGQQLVITVDNGTALLQKGAPDLPKLAFSLIIPNDKNSSISVLDTKYTDIPSITVAPSKGKIYRDQKPSQIPFTYGDEYQKNAFFPAHLASLNTPFIIRDYRGQTVHVNPVQYNPITKTLRVYHSLKLKIEYNGKSTTNVLPSTEPIQDLVDIFDGIYADRFINYKTSSAPYTPTRQNGSILVVCPALFLDDIAPYVQWKEQKGFKVFLCNTDTLSGGVNETGIRSVATHYYNTHQIAYMLIVGDHPIIPTRNADYAQFPMILGPSDNAYAYQSGNDHYPEFIVGRFSGDTKQHIQTMVARTLSYEKTPNVSSNWMQHQVGIASDEGPGDDNQMDWEHMRELKDSNINHYHFVQKYELYEGSQGGADAPGNPGKNDLINHINSGVGLINYCGHGTTDAFSTTGFSNADMNSLTNTEGQWPVIIATACLNGNFTMSECLAESFLKASNASGAATGAAATIMSTILQSWDPPMQGQDEMNAIIRGERPGNHKSIFGAIAMDGCMSVNDHYNTAIDPDGGNEITDTWTIFGDPNLEIRTKHEGTLTCSHSSEIGRHSTWYTVACPIPDTRVGLYYQGKFLASAISQNGNATFTFPAITSLSDTVFITATKQNYLPYFGFTRIVEFPNSLSTSQTLTPTIFPNPSSEHIQILFPDIQHYSITDLSGRIIVSTSLSEPTSLLNIPVYQLSAGSYNIYVKSSKSNGQQLFTKL